MKLVVFCFTLRKHKDLQLRSLPLNPGLESINVGWLWHDSENIFWGMHGIYSNLEMTLILILTLILTVVPANMEQRRCLLMLIKQICLCFSCCNLSDSMRSSSSVRFWGIKWPWDVTSLCEGKLQLRIQLFQIFFHFNMEEECPWDIPPEQHNFNRKAELEPFFFHGKSGSWNLFSSSVILQLKSLVLLNCDSWVGETFWMKVGL